MELLIQVAVNGILVGGLYAVMALGLALVWGVLNIVNLAHGSFIMLGAYCSWYLFQYLHVDPFLGLPITAAVMFVLGYALQRGLLNLNGQGVDIAADGLDDYGKPGNYFARQLKRWSEQYRASEMQR